MRESGSRAFYIAGGTGRFWPGPPPLRASRQILSVGHPDQSNASEASRMVRIHLWHGFGPVALLSFLFSFFFIFLLVAPTFLIFGPPRMLSFLWKFLKEYHSFLICSWLFCGIFICPTLMEVICANSYLDLCTLCFCVNFLVRFFDPKCVMWCWCLAFNFMMSLPLMRC